MLRQCLHVLIFISIFDIGICKFGNDYAITASAIAVWKNATVPFYVDPDHFDHEQTMSILTALSMFAFKTCLKFKPVMAPPTGEDVMAFVNPDGVRRCQVSSTGHSVFTPHRIVLGYDCLKSPDIDMMIMKSLGFPFEHNRVNRDLYIDVLQENIEPGAIELFTKEDVLPPELRYMPYDINSVMHFGTRDYSKNGHRTIIFKDHTVQQNREGLTSTDLKKIEVVYGPECRTRDRQEKYDLCQSYPGVARKKRQADDNDLKDKDQSTIEPAEVRRKRDVTLVDQEEIVTRSLRVNPDITAPPDLATDITKTLKELGIDHSVQEIVEQVYKVSAEALKNARAKYCTNNSTVAFNSDDIKVSKFDNTTDDVLGIVEVVARFAKDMVDKATNNITKFCEESVNMEIYQRAGCNWGYKDPRCRETYYSTKSGGIRYSTQHRPVMQQSTHHDGDKNQRNRNYVRSMTHPNPIQAVNETQSSTTPTNRRKRENVPVESVSEAKAEPAVDGKQEENKTEAITQNRDAGSEIKTDNKELIQTKSEGHEAEKNEQGRRYHGHVHRARLALQKPADLSEDKISLGVKRLHYNVLNKRQKTLQRQRTVTRGRTQQRYNKGIRREPIRSKKMVLAEDKALTADKRVRKVMKRVPENIHAKKSNTDVIVTLNEEEESPEESVSENGDEANIKFIKGIIEKNVKSAEKDEEVWKPSQKLRQKHKKKAVVDDPIPRTVELTKLNEEFYKERWWPEGILRYVIQEGTSYDLTDMRQRLAEVNEILKKKTCISIKEITRAEAKGFEDFIVIDNSPDYITGRTGGEQRFGCIELFKGGQHRQHAAMMVMAMLGFYFEVSRHDRDKYIRVHPRHVRPDKLHHFEKIRSDAMLDLPYDYESATHPAWQFWRQLGRTGISTVATYKEKDPDGKIMKMLGQHSKLLSDTDIIKINSVYGIECFLSEAQVKAHDGNYTVA